MKICSKNVLCILFILLTFFSVGFTGEKVFCSLCSVEIEGRHVRFKDGDSFCNDCMEGPKCIQCGKPTKNMVENVSLCEKCSINPNRCGLCNKIIGRKVIVFPLSTKYYCKECTQNYPRCRFCSAPTKSKATYGLKWSMCEECKGKSLSGVGNINSILSEVEAIIQSNLHLTLPRGVGLEVCSDITKEGRGMNGDEMGLMQQLGGTCVILIQDGLPEEMVYETLAHEWAHAWLAQNAKYAVSTTIEEGFCQWVASKVLIDKGYDENLNILRSRNDLYGTGYRKIEKVEISRGVTGVTEYVNNTKPGLFKKLFGRER